MTMDIIKALLEGASTEDVAKSLRDEVLKMAKAVSGRDFTLSDEALRGIFQWIEDHRPRQAAASNVNAAFDTAQASIAIDLAHIGVTTQTKCH
jgi:hypothetical protein